jgi:hypothetical protein
MPVTTSTVSPAPPAFPATLPPHLEAAWQAIARRPERASVRPLDGGGVAVTLKRSPGRALGLALGVVAFGAAALLAVWALDRYQSSPDYDQPFRFRLFKFYMLAGMCTLGGAIALLVVLASSGDSDTVLEVWRGRLKVDRWLSGDHVVREYTPAEISLIWSDSAMGIGYRRGDFAVAHLAPNEVLDAAAEIVGTVFWGDEAVVRRDAPSPMYPEVKVRVAVLRAQQPADALPPPAPRAAP